MFIIIYYYYALAYTKTCEGWGSKWRHCRRREDGVWYGEEVFPYQLERDLKMRNFFNFWPGLEIRRPIVLCTCHILRPFWCWWYNEENENFSV